MRIGDQWNAINIIAQSQTHPLKAVCELAENAIDARASHVHILRRRIKGQLYLEVADDGVGVPLNDDGEPDFATIATHICDSMKRHLDDRQRVGIHGEFGIGLLSFWSLGEALRMVSSSHGGKLVEMRLDRGNKSYQVNPVRGQLPLGGTRITVGPLLDSTRNIVTGEKLVQYLSAELRDRIRNTGVELRVIDRVARKEIVVTPREFEGERVDIARRITTPEGDLLLELYFHEGNNKAESNVAICKDGTRVHADITELDQFQHAPWSERQLEGVLDFASLTLAPGTRHGIVPDERLEAFVHAVESIEPTILQALEQREQAQSDRASRQILRQVHKAFMTALRELPSNEYLFFDIPDAKRALSKAPSDATRRAAGEQGLTVTASDDAAGEEEHHDEQGRLDLTSGPLASVRITPRHARRKPGDNCPLQATARDDLGKIISEQVGYCWEIHEGSGQLSDIEQNRCAVTSAVVGAVEVEVCAKQGEHTVTDRVTVKFMEHLPSNAGDQTKGLPSYRLEAEPGRQWRSRYDEPQNEIVINSAHRDFLSSKNTAAKHRRYVGKLYAKEVVLINFPHESPGEVMERLIELTLRTEDAL